jgi:PAS domain S-box-containing protein
MTDYSATDFWEEAPSGLVIAHPNGRILRVNATATRWLGYEANELCDMMFTDLLTAGGRILYETHFGPLLQVGGDLNGVTVDIVGADGTSKPMFLTANVKIDAARKPELLRISVVDAADRRAYEVELLEARRLAVTEQQRVREFADTLRRPLLPPVLSPPVAEQPASANAEMAMTAAAFFFECCISIPFVDAMCDGACVARVVRVVQVARGWPGDRLLTSGRRRPVRCARSAGAGGR